MLDLIRLSRRPLFPPGGLELCRQIALLTDMRAGLEVLVVPSGLAVTLEYFVREHDVQGSGVEPDAALLEQGEDRLREQGILDRVHLQEGQLDHLPFRDEIFDVTIGELGLTASVEPGLAVAELARVTRPGGMVVLVQPSWKAPVEPARQAVLSDHLGARPLMLVEWKALLAEAGLEQFHTEDWSDEETAFRPQVSKPFPDFAELFTVAEKLGILRRAWKRWGWRGVTGALAREREVHNLLTRERIMGLDLVRAVKTGARAESSEAESSVEELPEEIPEVPEEEVGDLPLFSETEGT
jgi:SAM-dependent methyltransferase